ncbi:hypothetical protein J3F84DRAFT_303500 [Trichoderma pleuroticola]
MALVLFLWCYLYVPNLEAKGGECLMWNKSGHVSRLPINVASTYDGLHHAANESERKHFTRFWLIGQTRSLPVIFGIVGHSGHPTPPGIMSVIHRQLSSACLAQAMFFCHQQKRASLPPGSGFPSPK